MDLHRVAPGVLLAFALAMACFATLQSARLAFRSWRIRRRLQLSQMRGAVGEENAEALLGQLGFDILGRQVGAQYALDVDGQTVPVSLRADFVVGDRRGRYVAEVKTGDAAPRIETIPTRRQLLEYRLAFQCLDVRGVLLVDPEAGRVRRVEFPLFRAQRPRRAPQVTWLVAGFAAGTLGFVLARLFP